MRKLVFATLAFMPALALAATLYKSIGPDGRVVYSDRPPQNGKVEKTFNFANLPSTPLPDSVLRYRQELEKGLQNRLAAGDAKQPVLFTAKWCGYCRQAEAYLAEKRVAYTKHDIDTPGGMRAFAESRSGKGVPVLLFKEQKVQGYSRPAYDSLFARR